MPRDEYPARQGRGVPAVRAPREIHDRADWLRAALLASAADGHAKLVVDVSSTQFADPEGLRMPVHANERALAEAGLRGCACPASSSGARPASSGSASLRASSHAIRCSGLSPASPPFYTHGGCVP